MLSVFYILIGYPLIVGWLARRSKVPTRKKEILPSVTAILAVHNGGSFLEKKLDSLLGQDYPEELLDVIVISDGSTDNTAEVVRRFSSARVKLVEIERAGKPRALNAGIEEARGEILFFNDARQTLNPPCLRRLVENFADPRVGAVSGELVIGGAGGGKEENAGLYWRFEVWLRDCLAAMDSMLGATGACYCLRRALAVPVPPETILDDMYLPLKGAFFAGFRLVLERRANAYDVPMPLKTEFRRKVRTLAGNWQLLWLMPELMSGRNRMLWHFLSYKLGRLLLPWLLLLVLLTSFLLPKPFSFLFGATQLLLYISAAVALLLPEGVRLKKILSPLTAFLVMMLASALAVKIFFVPPADLWRVTDVGPGK